MRISKPRYNLYKQQIRSLIATQPKISNLELAQATGLHRNTVPKLLNDIYKDNEVFIRERWKCLLNDVTSMAFSHIERLDDQLHDIESRGGGKAIIGFTKLDWQITKELYRLHLEYMGIKEAPKSLIQVNIKK